MKEPRKNIYIGDYGPRLEAEAQATGLSMSEIIRQGLDLYFAREKRKAKKGESDGV